jgi:DNA repair exonuclease SbcCD nuclease subunit
VPRIRILLLADTHLGFDMPFRPRVERRRRGPDFFANYERALKPALQGQVDVVVHGGDLLYRSRVPAKLVDMAVEPLRRVADAGVPVVLVPGNHERSEIPFPILAQHAGIHVYRRPETFELDVGGETVAFAGFPCVRNGVRERFRDLVEATDWRSGKGRLRFLCVHQSVEGATVGVQNFVFRPGPDVIRGADIPEGLDGVLAGHIHRFQVLERDLAGRPLGARVFYPGAIERTSFVEREESKGYVVVEGDPDSGEVRWRFKELPARDMVVLDVPPDLSQEKDHREWLRAALGSVSPDAVVLVRIGRNLPESCLHLYRAASLRALAGSGITLSTSWPRSPATSHQRRS